MPADYTGPCGDWTPVWMCDLTGVSAAVTGQSADAAAEMLDALTGRQFGLCTVTLRPCRRDCAEAWGYYPGSPAGWGGTYPMPALIGGQWFNLICGTCGDNCSCTAISEVLLPAPVYAVTEVKVDGVILDPAAYRIDDNRRLVLLGATWPACNDLNLADTEAGTWSVTATYGQPLTTLGQLALGELACELIRLRTEGDCALPPNVTQLVRQGVTLTFADIRELLPDGLPGLYLADRFIRTVNPHGLARRARTYSVDTPNHRRVGT